MWRGERALGLLCKDALMHCASWYAWYALRHYCCRCWIKLRPACSLRACSLNTHSSMHKVYTIGNIPASSAVYQRVVQEFAWFSGCTPVQRRPLLYHTIIPGVHQQSRLVGPKAHFPVPTYRYNNTALFYTSTHDTQNLGSKVQTL